MDERKAEIKRAKCLKKYMKGLQAYNIDTVYRTGGYCWCYRDDHGEYVNIMEDICIDLEELYSDDGGIFLVQDIIDTMNYLVKGYSYAPR